MRILLLLLLLLLVPRPLFAQNQVQDKPTAAAPANDDWLLLSGNTYKQRKIDPAYFGRVSSVGLSLPSIFAVSGSPVTTTGTLTGTLATQSANLVWAGPTTGAAAAPTFRSLVAADIPSLSSIYQPLSSVLTNTTASFTTALESKLSGIATGATANSTDAQLRDRSTHTGTQALSTISQSGATTDQVPKWSGSAWVPGTITTGVSSVNGQTGAVTVQPLPTYAALASDALTLGHDGITRTDTISATKNLTLASAGSSGDERILDFTVTGGTQTVTTNFAVIRNLAGSASTVSRVFKDRAWIKMVNVNGTIHWFDNGFDAVDLPVGNTPVSFTPAADNVKAYFDAVDAAIAALSATISGIDNAPIGMGGQWTTSDIANRPLNWLINDGTNGTPNAGTIGNGNMTAIIKGGGTVATPAVSNGIVAGTYTGSRDVGVASATAGTSLYYTFGSSPTDPTTSDTLVSGTIPVTATGTLKVKGFKPLYNASSVFSAAYTINPAFTYLLSDDLVYASTGAATTAGWTSTASPVWNYTTAPAPLGGLASSVKTFWGDAVSHSFTATSDVWVYVMFNIVSCSSSPKIFSIGDGTNNLLRGNWSAGNLSIGYGVSGGGSATVACAVGTTYHMWLHYVKGTGSNGLIQIYMSTDGIKGSVLGSVGFTTGTTDANSIVLQCTTNGTIVWNKLRISATSIGDNPL